MENVQLQALDPKNLESQLVVEKSRRKLMQAFISSELTEGTDYGKIKMGGRESKNCLFKPGAEKFCSLLQLRADFTKDEETLSMLSQEDRLIAYVCRLVHIPSGNVIAEGRGACSPKEKSGVVNTAIKIAEKRAQIDAVLRLGFSDSFTQDLEDVTEEPQVEKDKKTILSLLVKIDPTVTTNPPTKNRELVKLYTGLDPVSVNYPEIIDRLEVILQGNK